MARMRFFILFAILSLAVICGTVAGADRVAADAYLAGVPTLIASGDFKAVEDLCKRSLAADDTCPAAHYYMAIALEKSNKPRDAFKEYQTATTLAAKEKDNNIGGKASAAAKKLGAGLMEIDALDQKLADKLQKVAAEATELGRLETARQALTSLLILQPENAKAKEALEKVNKAIQDRGDPVRTKIAAAMLTEMWFKLGTGKRDDAIAMARTLSTRFSDTEWGKEASTLLENNFSVPKREDVAQLSQQLKEQNAKLASAQKTQTPTAVTTTSPKAGSGKPDIGALEKTADEEAKKMHKDVLVSAFTDAYQKGKAFYANATPGAEGNQENLSKALEQFIRAESFFARIESEDLKSDELSNSAQEAAMLRYACMKMTILTH